MQVSEVISSLIFNDHQKIESTILKTRTNRNKLLKIKSIMYFGVPAISILTENVLKVQSYLK